MGELKLIDILVVVVLVVGHRAGWSASADCSLLLSSLFVSCCKVLSCTFTVGCRLLTGHQGEPLEEVREVITGGAG